MAGNIYKNARLAAGLTQERWAEHLGLAVDTIRRYENDDRLPDDFTVKKMAEVAAMPVLGYWHLCHKSEIAAAELPRVEQMSFSRAVINLLLCVKQLSPDVDMLLEIAKDDKVEGYEEATFEEIARDLDGLIAAAYQVKYAEYKDDSANNMEE